MHYMQSLLLIYNDQTFYKYDDMMIFSHKFIISMMINICQKWFGLVWFQGQESEPNRNRTAPIATARPPGPL